MLVCSFHYRDFVWRLPWALSKGQRACPEQCRRIEVIDEAVDFTLIWDWRIGEPSRLSWLIIACHAELQFVGFDELGFFWSEAVERTNVIVYAVDYGFWFDYLVFFKFGNMITWFTCWLTYIRIRFNILKVFIIQIRKPFQIRTDFSWLSFIDWFSLVDLLEIK